MKNHGYDKERALTLTQEELDELAKNIRRDKEMIDSVCSIKSINAAQATYFSSLHSINSLDDGPQKQAVMAAELENFASQQSLKNMLRN